ncbi:hypothetical protein Trydic_g20540 [Trypoxylus dichotomus]
MYFLFGQCDVKANSPSERKLVEFASFAHLDIEVYGMYTYCAGSYIDSYWIVTTAHCLDLNKRGPTKLGEQDRIMVIMGIAIHYESNPGRQWRKSVKLVVHPKYYTEKQEEKSLKDTDRKQYDIGMIKLDRAFEITEKVAVGLIPLFIPENTHFSVLNYLFDEMELTDCVVSLTLIVCKYDDFEKIDGAPIYLSENKQIVGIVGGNNPGEYNVNVINYRDWIQNVTTRKLPVYKPKLGESLVRRFTGTSVNKCCTTLNRFYVTFYSFFLILRNILS